jgi:hypothetical protein
MFRQVIVQKLAITYHKLQEKHVFDTSILSDGAGLVKISVSEEDVQGGQ